MDYQPRPAIPTKKNARDRLITWASQQSNWAIGFLDEVWWSRFALPRLQAWQAKDQPMRLVEQSWQKGDPDPKAFACYGVLWQQGPATEPIRNQMSLRFVTGRPVSAMTTQFLEWCCQRLQAQGKTSWLLIWDNASLYVNIKSSPLDKGPEQENPCSCELLNSSGKVSCFHTARPIMKARTSLT